MHQATIQINLLVDVYSYSYIEQIYFSGRRSRSDVVADKLDRYTSRSEELRDVLVTSLARITQMMISNPPGTISGGQCCQPNAFLLQNNINHQQHHHQLPNQQQQHQPVNQQQQDDQEQPMEEDQQANNALFNIPQQQQPAAPNAPQKSGEGNKYKDKGNARKHHKCTFKCPPYCCKQYDD